MYITKVVLDKVRNFKKLELKFIGQGEALLIAADNGEGKTTILRSIAMGLCDESSAAGLLRELPGEFVRKGFDDATISIHLESKDRAHFEIETKIYSLPAFERVKQRLFEYNNGEKQEIEIVEKFPWNEIFVSGYGAGRQTQGTADIDEYTAVDAVYSLFRYDDPMQNAELAIRRLVEKARKSAGFNAKESEDRAEAMLRRLSSTLKKLLNLDPGDKVIITPTSIEVKGHWGRNKFGSLGDGYKSTITWVMDLLSWRMLSRRWSIRPEKFSGIVLIDEVEQHLHPRWQINVMQLLRDTFPKIQFIATTHSPLTVSGCKDCRVLSIKRGKFQVDKVYGWLAEDVYDEVMGLSSSRAQPVSELVKQYENLYFQKLKGTISDTDRGMLEQVENKLKQLSFPDTSVLSARIKNLKKYLDQVEKDPRS